MTTGPNSLYSTNYYEYCCSLIGGQDQELDYERLDLTNKTLFELETQFREDNVALLQEALAP